MLSRKAAATEAADDAAAAVDDDDDIPLGAKIWLRGERIFAPHRQPT